MAMASDKILVENNRMLASLLNYLRYKPKFVENLSTLVIQIYQNNRSATGFFINGFFGFFGFRDFFLLWDFWDFGTFGI